MTNTKKSGSRTVIAYCRVSTEEQANEGVSLEAQAARIRAYCAMRGLELVDVIVDAGVSAGKPLSTRDGGRRLLGLVRCHKAQAVVALKLDRLFRNCADCLSVISTWDKAGIALHLVDLGGQAVDTSSAMGRFFLTVMAGAAELERNQIAERTSIALKHMAAKGEYTGGKVKFGFRLDDTGKLEAVVDELVVVELARRLRGEGMSLRAVASQLAAAGHVSRAGKPFVPCQVAKMAAA